MVEKCGVLAETNEVHANRQTNKAISPGLLEIMISPFVLVRVDEKTSILRSKLVDWLWRDWPGKWTP